MQNIFRNTKFGIISLVLANTYVLANQFVYALPNSIVPGSGKAPTKASGEKDTPKSVEAAKDNDADIINAIAVTPEQLVDKPQEYLNKDVKFTAKFASFNSLALDYKPAFRSSRNYLSFLVFRPDSHIPFSELKLAMPIPKEKDPETHMLQTLKEGDSLEVYGKVFACPLDEPWLDVTKIKKLGGSPVKGKTAEDNEEEQSTENKHE